MLNELGRTVYERARQERGSARRAARLDLLQRARARLEQVLDIDPENLTAHYNLALVHTELEQPALAQRHRELHDQYRPDDQAIERAVSAHRSRNPAPNHAAEAAAIYDLQRAATAEREATLSAAEIQGKTPNHAYR